MPLASDLGFKDLGSEKVCLILFPNANLVSLHAILVISVSILSTEQGTK